MNWRIAVWTIIGGLVAAVIAGTVGILSAQFGAETTLKSSRQQADAALATSRQQAETALETNRLQIAEGQAIVARDKRAKVYTDYLKAAGTYRDRSESTAQTVAVNDELGRPYSANAAALVEFNDARRAYQDQINQVAIYGSGDAWNEHLELAKAMPNPIGSVTVKRPDQERFSTYFRAFAAVFCKEVNPTASEACTAKGAVGAPR